MAKCYIKIFFLLAAGLGLTHEKKLAFRYTTDEQVKLSIFGVYDELGILQYYTCRIKTPVCRNDYCDVVEIDFFWDILGNFTEFQLLPDKPLTKLDHVPFSKADYDRLRTILLDQNPPFMHLRKSQLLAAEPLKDAPDVDAVSGATAKHLKEMMVEGAAFTCFTLWHIANGDIHFQMQEHTRQNLNELQVRHLLDSGGLEVQYFLIENMEPAHFALFLDELMGLMENADAYMLNRFVQGISGDLLEKPVVQQFLVKRFELLDPPAETALLHGLMQEEVSLSATALKLLVDQLDHNYPDRNKSIISIVCNQAQGRHPGLIKDMCEYLVEQQIVISRASLELLTSVSRQDRSLRKLIGKLRRGN